MEKIKNLYLADFPLHVNEELTAIVNAEGKPVFDFVHNNVDAVFAHRICAKLNGGSGVYFAHAWTAHEESIAYNGRRVLDIRGWGRLTEVYGLTGREAEWEQEEFLLWCVERLNAEAPEINARNVAKDA
jgi:hypothetical protein